VATISRFPENIGLFCKRALEKRLYSAKEFYIFKEPTHHSHPITPLGTAYVQNLAKNHVFFSKETHILSKEPYGIHLIVWASVA